MARTEKYEVCNRFSGAVQFVAEIECDEDAPRSTKLGLAVRWAIKTRADLTGANLAYADLARSNLYGSNLYGSDLTGSDLSYADLAYADLSYADLAYADLAYADLTRANLTGANLTYAYGIEDRIIDGGLRSDGYRFLLTRAEPGEFRIKAGCRNFTVSEAKAHWDKTRPKGEPLGDETRLIIKHMLAVAKLRGWKPLKED